MNLHSSGVAASVEMRARKHAALGDPSRLRMLDLLTFGDLSPSDLGDEMDLPSNLVAHHLNVLEREGIVVRFRSEGDGRRAYVRLKPGALVQLGSFAAAGARRVLFLSTTNAARSQFAQALWNDVSEIPALSAGTHPAVDVDPRAVAVATRHGLDLNAARPQPMDALVREDDFVITVCDRAYETYRGTTAHWSVPDPAPTGSDQAFEAAFADLARRVSQLAPRLLALD